MWIALVVGCVGCGDKKAPAPAAPPEAAPAAPTPPKPEPEAVAEPAPAPAPATPDKPAEPEDPGRDDTIALHLGAPGSDAFALPVPGKAARVRVTPIDGKGRPVPGLVSQGDGAVVMVALRNDGAFGVAMGPTEAGGPAAVFDLTFPLPGPHTLLFGYRREGGKLHVDTAAVRVSGDWSAKDMDATQTKDTAAGLTAELVPPAEGFVVCKPNAVVTRFTRRGKKTEVAGVHVAAVPLSRDGMSVGEADAEGHTTLRFDSPGIWHVFARALVKGKPTSWHFHVQVGGERPAEGCL